MQAEDLEARLAAIEARQEQLLAIADFTRDRFNSDRVLLHAMLTTVLALSKDPAALFANFRKLAEGDARRMEFPFATAVGEDAASTAVQLLTEEFLELAERHASHLAAQRARPD